MQKSKHRVRRRSALPAVPDTRRLLDRILDAPNPARAVARLEPAQLHRVIDVCGLEDCGDLVALATPAQLTRVFDLDLWCAPAAGQDEQFDADRFAVWLEVLVDASPEVAAEKLAGMDVAFVATAFAQHVRVFEVGVVTPFTSLEGEQCVSVRPAGDGPACDIGGYRVKATGADAWDAVVAALSALSEHHPAFFGAVMHGCRLLSNSTPEIDWSHDLLTRREQAMFDVAIDREERRDAEGYVTPAQARAFLDLSRTRVVARQPRALTRELRTRSRLALIHAQLEFVRDHDPVAYSTRSSEMGYLANALIAGCSIQSRAFTIREAADAAAAICNLGLENWPDESLPEDFLVSHDLIGAFQTGWTVLHDDVCMHTAAQLIDILSELRCDDVEIQSGLDTLRVELLRHARAGTPWLARDALDVIASLDMPAWAALLALIAECPVKHAAIGALLRGGTREVSASAFEFVSENSQIAEIRRFLQVLPEIVRR